MRTTLECENRKHVRLQELQYNLHKFVCTVIQMDGDMHMFLCLHTQFCANSVRSSSCGLPREAKRKRVGPFTCTLFSNVNNNHPLSVDHLKGCQCTCLLCSITKVIPLKSMADGQADITPLWSRDYSKSQNRNVAQQPIF